MYEPFADAAAPPDPQATPDRPTAAASAQAPALAADGQASATSPQGSGQPHHTHVPLHYARRTVWHLALLVLAGALILTGIYLWQTHQHKTTEAALAAQVREAMEQPPSVTVARVQTAEQDTPLVLPGECRGWFESTVFARINGYVSKWDHDIGDHVKAGDVLATIDTPELDEQINVARAKLASLHADVKLAQAAVDFAKITFERFRAGAPDGVVSQQETDQKESELAVSRAKLESAQAQVDLGEAEVRQLQDLANFQRVVAPFDGVVTQRHIDIGNLVTAGSTSNTTPLFTVCQADQIRVYVDVPQSARSSIRVGLPADVTAREFPDRVFHGRVDRTAEAINAASGTLRVEVLLPNPKGDLVPGMFAEVAFHNHRTDPPLQIPAGALLLRADGPHVAVVSTEDRLHFQPITIARDLGDTIEVSQGLSGLETVALNLSNDITEGQRVTPVAIDAPPAKPIAHAEVRPGANPNPTSTADTVQTR